MQKSYERINWENYPSDKTPLNEANLNKLDVATDEIDNRVITLDNTKFDKTEASKLIKNFELDKATGIITITYLSGATVTIDTLLEKLAVNFDFDEATQKIIITLDDGTVKEVDLSSFITEYEFLDSDTVAFTVDTNGKVVAIVKEGSIEEKHLRPDYLADIKVEVAKAESSIQQAEAQANASKDYSDISRSYAIGTNNEIRQDDSTDNSKYYYQESKKIYDNFSSASNVYGVKGEKETEYRSGFVNITAENVGALSKTGDNSNTTTAFTQAMTRANISTGEKLSAIMGKISKWFADLKTVAFTGSYNDLSNKPTASDLGLGNVNNTADKDKSVKYATSAGSATKATQDGNGNVIDATYLPYGGYYPSTVSINDMTTVGIYRKYLDCNDDDSVYLGGNISGHLAIIVTKESGHLRQYIIGFTGGVAGRTWWRQNATQGDIKFAYDDALCTLNYSTTPTVGDNSTRIATTEWVNKLVQNSAITVGSYPYNGITDLLKFPIGTYRFGSNSVINQYANTPNKAGILQVESIDPSKSPWEHSYGYRQYTFHTYQNDLYIRVTDSGASAGVVNHDTGWVKITTNSQILNTATDIEASTSSENIVGVQGLKEYVGKGTKVYTVPAGGNITIGATALGITTSALMHVTVELARKSGLYSIIRDSAMSGDKLYTNEMFSNLPITVYTSQASNGIQIYNEEEKYAAKVVITAIA